MLQPARRGAGGAADRARLARRRRGRRFPAAAIGQPLAEAAEPLGRCRQRPSRGSLFRACADGRRVRHLHRADAAAQRLSGVPPRRPAAQLRPGGRRSAPLALGGDRADRRADPAAGAAARRAGRPDRRPLRSCARASFVLIVQADVPTETLRRLFPARSRSARSSTSANWSTSPCPGIAVRPLPVAPRQIPFYAGASLFRARPQQPALAADAVLGRLRDPCVGGFPESAHGTLGDPRLAVGGATCSDNPFAEPDDSDRTVIRPRAGRPPAAPRPRAPPAEPPPRRRRAAGPPRPALEGAEAVRDRRSTPLAAAAAPLLQLMARLRNTLSPARPRRPARARGAARCAVSSRRRATPACRSSSCRRRITRCAPASTTWCSTRPGAAQGVWDAALAGLDLPPGGAQRRTLLRRARPDAAEPRHVPAGHRADVSLHVARLPGPLPAVAARPGRARPACARRPTRVIARQRQAPEPGAVAALEGRRRALPPRPARSVPVWVGGGGGAGGHRPACSSWFSTGAQRSIRRRCSPACWRRRRHECRTIVRAAPVQPPPPAPAPPQPGALDRLRGSCSPRSTQGLVAVVGSDACPWCASATAACSPRAAPS